MKRQCKREPYHTSPSTVISLCLLVAGVLGPVKLDAASLVWTGAGTSSAFNLSSNWSGNVAPLPGDSAFFTSTTAARAIVSLTNVNLNFLAVSGRSAVGPYEFRSGGSPLTVDNTFSISPSTGMSMTSGAAITTSLLFLETNAALGVTNATLTTMNAASRGHLLVQAGARLAVGETARLDDSGKLTVSGGGDVIAGGYFDVGAGDARTASMIIEGAGSTLTAGGPFATDWGASNGDATVTITNGGSATYNAGLSMGTNGSSSSAIVNIQAGGTLNVNGLLQIGEPGANSGSGSLTVSGGFLNAHGTTNINGNFVVNLDQGGTAQFFENVTIGPGAELRAKADAVLSVSADKLIDFAGGTGVIQSDYTLPAGSFWRVRNGGSLTVQGAMDVAVSSIAASNVLTVADGSLLDVATPQVSNWAPNAGNQAFIYVTGGTLRYNSDVNIAQNGGYSYLQITGGEFKSNGLNVGGHLSSTAIIEIDGGTFRPTRLNLGQGSTIRFFNGTWFRTAQLSMSGNAVLRLMPGMPKVMETSSLTMSDSSLIDISDSSLVVTFGTASPINAIRDLLRRGFNDGNWGGAGITSNVAATDPAKGVGYFTSPGRITMRVALYGDANGDNAVDFSDLLALAQAYGSAGKYWSGGDFNYDGVVDFSDLLKLAQNYGSAQSLTDTAGFDPAFLADWSAARSMVPEPFSILAVAMPTFATRRRASR